MRHNGSQPYAVVCLPVRWENCVKGAVTCVRGVVREPVVILLKPFLARELKH